MYKINFDIGQIDEDVALSQCRIVMELGTDVFNYLVADADNRILKVKYYRLESDDYAAYLEQLEELLKQDALLQQPAREVVVIYQFPESHLVPVSHFNMDQNKTLLDLLHGDLNKGVMLSEKVDGWDTYNVYRIGTDLHQLLQQKFTNIRYCHQYSLLLQSLQPAAEEANNSISVSFYSHCFIAAVVQQKELQLIQRFAYHTAEDAAYWLLNIYHQFNFTQEETILLVDGMIDGDSAMFTELKKYFTHVNLVASPQAIQTGDLLNGYPQHFFSPILKMALCAS